MPPPSDKRAAALKRILVAIIEAARLLEGMCTEFESPCERAICMFRLKDGNSDEILAEYHFYEGDRAHVDSRKLTGVLDWGTWDGALMNLRRTIHQHARMINAHRPNLSSQAAQVFAALDRIDMSLNA